jgi:hypothetical protein
MSNYLVPAVETRGVSAQQPFHAGDQIGLGCFHHQMEMITHQTPGMDPPTVFSQASPNVS